MDAPDPSINLLAAARWYSHKEAVVQASLDNAEPLTWLKHLLDKHSNKTATRLPWHLSALIIEEYARSRGRTLDSIPEDSVANDVTVGPDLSPVVSGTTPESKPTSKSPSSDSWSWTPPSQPLEPSLSRRRRDTYDAGITFEPQVDSGRSSAGADSRRSSLDPLSHRRYSLAYGTDSARSSTHNGMYGASPGSSRHFLDFANRMRRKAHNRSDDGLSSARNSISEHSHEEESSPSKGKGRSRPMSLQLGSPGSRPGSRDGRATAPHSPSEPAMSSAGEGPQTARQVSPFIPFVESAPPSRRPSRTASRNPSRSASPGAEPKTPKPHLRQRRLSLPSLNQLLLREQEKRQVQADEEQERREYEQKSQSVYMSLVNTCADVDLGCLRMLLPRISAHASCFNGSEGIFASTRTCYHDYLFYLVSHTPPFHWRSWKLSAMTLRLS